MNNEQIEINKIESPCIRQCTLDRNDVCVGCFRHIDEIVGWGKMPDEKKKSILVNCEKRKLSHTNRNKNVY